MFPIKITNMGMLGIVVHYKSKVNRIINTKQAPGLGSGCSASRFLFNGDIGHVATALGANIVVVRDQAIVTNPLQSTRVIANAIWIDFWPNYDRVNSLK
jgi:hypothetical protein